MANEINKLRGLQDSRGARGILSRGTARYGISRAPKPGNIFNVQKAAKAKMKKINELGRYR